MGDSERSARLAILADRAQREGGLDGGEQRELLELAQGAHREARELRRAQEQAEGWRALLIEATAALQRTVAALDVVEALLQRRTAALEAVGGALRSPAVLALIALLAILLAGVLGVVQIADVQLQVPGVAASPEAPDGQE